MMIIVAILGETGVFYWVGIKAGKTSNGNLWKLMLLLCTFTAGASMFIDNVTTILLMVPVTLSITRTLKVPPNILIGSAANIDFNSFLIYMGPTMAIIFIWSLISLRIFFRKELQQEQLQEKESDIHHLLERNEDAVIKDKNMLIKSLIVLVGAIILFSLQGITHMDVSIVAIGAAAVLLLITRAQLERILHEVDWWPTLFFFVGLFVIVGVAQHAGLINVLAKVAINLTGGNPWLTFVIVIWLSGIASAFVDNIPFTAT